MIRGRLLAAGLVVTALARPVSQPVRAAAEPSYRATLDQYCVTCHNQRLKTAGLTLDTLSLDDVADQADTWEKVVKKLRARVMPPQGARRPDEATYHALIAWLEGDLDRTALAHPDPGRPMLHRLNRAEYANAIRDLLALDVDVASMLPPDDSAYGFDNISDVLGVSPSLQERYLSAALRIGALAVGDPAFARGERHLPGQAGSVPEPAHRGPATGNRAAASVFVTGFRWTATTSSRPSCIAPT